MTRARANEHAETAPDRAERDGARWVLALTRFDRIASRISRHLRHPRLRRIAACYDAVVHGIASPEGRSVDPITAARYALPTVRNSSWELSRVGILELLFVGPFAIDPISTAFRDFSRMAISRDQTADPRPVTLRYRRDGEPDRRSRRDSLFAQDGCRKSWVIAMTRFGDRRLRVEQ